MQIWRLEKQGRFPKRIRIGANRIAWSYSEVMAWIAACKARRG
jgi:prophage regulatory protein